MGPHAEGELDRRMALAIAKGSSAREIAVFRRTAEAPSSIAITASEGRSDPRIDDDRHRRPAADQFEVRRIGDPHSGAYQRSHRRDGGGAEVGETLAEHGVVGA
jgi:hypothetical protein